jgi:ribosomal protein L11 methylase PrmA
MNAVSGAVKLRPMDVVNVSMRLLEKTDWDFLPTIKVETEDKTNPLLSMSREEITQRIMELSSSLNINTTIQNDNEWTIQLSSNYDAKHYEESTWIETSWGEEESNETWESGEGK